MTSRRTRKTIPETIEEFPMSHEDSQDELQEESQEELQEESQEELQEPQGSKKKTFITLPWESEDIPKKSTMTIPLKYPINISRLIPRDSVLIDAFGRCATKTLDITCFSSVKFVMTQLGFAIRNQHPDFHWRVYAYRSIRKTKEDVVGNLKLDFNIDLAKKFIHVNVELLK